MVSFTTCFWDQHWSTIALKIATRFCNLREGSIVYQGLMGFDIKGSMQIYDYTLVIEDHCVDVVFSH